jgi:hypothetical protein
MERDGGRSKGEAQEFYSPLQNNSLTHTRKTGVTLQNLFRKAMQEMS